MRWLVLDEIIAIEQGKRARSRSRIPETTLCADGAGSLCCSPEILMIEMMAQTGGLLLGAEKDYAEDIIFAKIDCADFQNSLCPGTPIEIEATSDCLRPEGAWFEGTIRSARGRIGGGRFLLMNVGHFRPGESRSITFHDRFMKHFQVRSKVVR